MKSKIMIFLLLISVAGFSQIRHDQLRKPVIESTDTVLMFKNTSMGFEYTRTVLDTTIIKGLDLFVKERVSDSTSYLLGRLNDTVTYILGQIPTTLVELDSSGFRITESQISDLKDYLTVEVDPVYSSWDKSSGISITESQISDLKAYLLSEVDPVYSLDSAKIVWFKDLVGIRDTLAFHSDSLSVIYNSVDTLTTSVYDSISSHLSRIEDLEIKPETDPIFTASQAANITAQDITNLGSLSGVNTGDQDLSGLATKVALGDSTALLRSEIPDVSGFLITETDPIYANDSIKIVWFKDLKFTQDSLKTAVDSIQAHNTRLLAKQNLSDTLTYDATKHDLEQLKLTDLDSTGFSVDTTQVRSLLEFVQNNGGTTEGGYWEETIGGDTIQNNNLAPVKIQTSLLFGDEEVVTGSTGLFVYGGSYNTATATTYPIMKSVDYGATYNGLTQSERYFSNISVNSTGQYISYYNNSNVFLSNDFGATWSVKPVSAGTPISMSDTGEKMVATYFVTNTYYISTNYGSTFSNVTANGVTGNLSSAHITGDGSGIYLNGSEISKKVYYSTDGVNFTSFGGDLTTGSAVAALASGGSVFILLDGTLVKKSTNRGSWIDITPSGLLNATGELDITPDGTIIGLSNFNNTSALVTRDGGTNWYSLPSGSAVKFRTISLSSDGSDVYLGGNDGRIYKFEWIGSGYSLSTSILIGNGQVHVETNKGTSSISVYPFKVQESSNYLEASVNNQTAFKINQDGQFGLRTGGFASKINTTVTGDFSALITDKAVKDYIDGSGATMVYPSAGIARSTGTSWATSISPAVGYLYYNGANYTWNSGSSDGNNYPTTLVYTTVDRQLTLGRNGLSSISTFFPLASATDAGMIKVGSGLSIDGNGVLSSSGGVGDNIMLEKTTYSNLKGVIYKGGNSFIHDFSYGLNSNNITPDGRNIFIGELSGNFSLGATATLAGEASENIGIGYYSLSNLNTGSRNTAIGVSSLVSTTSGVGNSAIGWGSLTRNTTGSLNTAIGFISMLYNTTGNTNTAVGYASLESITGASDNNTALGSFALQKLLIGSRNIGIGVNSGSATALGGDNTSATNSIYIGYDTRPPTSGGTNQIIIGDQAVGKGSNTAVIGNASLNALYSSGQIVPVTKSTAPSSPVEGGIYYNTTDKHFYGYNGTTWVRLDN